MQKGMPLYQKAYPVSFFFFFPTRKKINGIQKEQFSSALKKFYYREGIDVFMVKKSLNL